MDLLQIYELWKCFKSKQSEWGGRCLVTSSMGIYTNNGCHIIVLKKWRRISVGNTDKEGEEA